MTAVRLVGRNREIQTLAVLGHPGIGKTALLGVAADMARSAGSAVLSAVVIESETQFPFAGLHQLLQPVMDRTSQLASLAGAGKLRSVVSQTFSLTDGRRAYESGGHPRPPGKTVLLVRE